MRDRTYVLVQFGYTGEFTETFMKDETVDAAFTKLHELVCNDPYNSQRIKLVGVLSTSGSTRVIKDPSADNKAVPTVADLCDNLLGNYYHDCEWYTIYEVPSINHFMRYLEETPGMLDFNYVYEHVIHEATSSDPSTHVYIVPVVQPDMVYRFNGYFNPTIERPIKENHVRKTFTINSASSSHPPDIDEEESF